MKQWAASRNNGFTIVELLIIIVVIAILATITIVGYNGVRSNSNDTKRAADMKTLSDAITLWSTTTKLMPESSGTGYANNGFGWVYGTGYANSLETMLIEKGYLKGQVRDPVRPTGNGAYMFYRCGTSTVNDRHRIYGVFARLDNPDRDGNQMSEWTSLGCANSAINSPYSSNYVRMIQL